jgi:hypothetical protein
MITIQINISSNQIGICTLLNFVEGAGFLPLEVHNRYNEILATTLRVDNCYKSLELFLCILVLIIIVILLFNYFNHFRKPHSI